MRTLVLASGHDAPGAGVACTQLPLVGSHTSPLGQVTATCTQPVVGLQESTVQGLPSSQLSGVPGRHWPWLQVSVPLQTLLSLHWVGQVTGASHTASLKQRRLSNKPTEV